MCVTCKYVYRDVIVLWITLICNKLMLWYVMLCDMLFFSLYYRRLVFVSHILFARKCCLKLFSLSILYFKSEKELGKVKDYSLLYKWSFRTTRLTPVHLGFVSFLVIPFIHSFHDIFVSWLTKVHMVCMSNRDQCCEASFLSLEKNLHVLTLSSSWHPDLLASVIVALLGKVK